MRRTSLRGQRNVPSRTAPVPGPTCRAAGADSQAGGRGPAPGTRPRRRRARGASWAPTGCRPAACLREDRGRCIRGRPADVDAFVFRVSKAFGRPPVSPLSPLTPGGPWNPRGPRAPRGPLGPRACFDDFPTCTTFVTVFWAAFPSGVAPSRATTSAVAASATARRCKALLKLAPCRAVAYPIAKVTRTIACTCCLPGSTGAPALLLASATGSTAPARCRSR